MLNIIDLVSKVLVGFSNHFIDSSIRRIYRALAEYEEYSDESIREECKAIVEGSYGKIREERFKELFIDKLFRLVISIIIKKRTDSLTVKILAIGIEAFRRVPCDLPPGSQLFPQQIKAAVALTQRCVVQMDTGEGKTYALLPAAFALVHKYGQVYIVCANEYLAHRDATRTKNYWDFVGVQVGLAIRGSAEENWACDIVYTTLSAIIFKHLNDDLKKSAPQFRLKFGCILLDEADAILLDNADQNYSVVRTIDSEVYDWESAIEFAKELAENEDITVDRKDLSAQLTLIGENKLKANLGQNGAESLLFHIQRYAIELSFIALNIVEKDIHYVEESDRFHPVNLITGQVEYEQKRNWLIPLEFLHGQKPRPETIELHTIASKNFLQLFKHVSGLSGTIQDDIVEYFLAYGFPTVIIKPRRPRYKGLQDDQIYRTKREAYNALYEKVLEMSSVGRPVLIGTQNIQAAERIYHLLISSSEMSEAVKVKLVTGKDETKIANIFSKAGEVGSVVVATQLAGRGVDIRLTEEAKENGGLALFCVEHAREMRHDKQFLGRAGRQGDPFTAKFICSLEDDLFKLFRGNAVSGIIMDTLGVEEGYVIENKMVTKSIARAQRRVRSLEFMRRSAKYFVEDAEGEIYERAKVWFQYVQIVDTFGEFKCSQPFLDWITDNFVNLDIANVISDSKVVNYEHATKILQVIYDKLGIHEHDNVISINDIEGRDSEQAAKQIKQKLLASINEKSTVSEKRYYWNREFYYCGLKIHRLTNFFRELESDITEVTLTNEKIDSAIEIIHDIISTVDKLKQQNDTKLGLVAEEYPALRSYTDAFCELKDLSNNRNHLNRMFAPAGDVLRELEQLGGIISTIEKQLWRYSNRTPRDIAVVTIQSIWRDYLQEKGRIKHRVYQQALTNLDFHRVLYDELTEEWDRLEGRLSSLVLHNLLNADHPEKLDEIFFYQDNQVISPDSLSDRQKLGELWDAKQDQIIASRYDGAKNDKRLISQFVLQVKNNLDSTAFTEDSLEQLLSDFVYLSPLSNLQSPTKIQEAIEKWFKTEILRGIAKPRRRVNHIWIRRFLVFLNEGGYISVLPSFRHQLASVIDRFKKNMTQAQTVLPIAQIALFLSLFVLLSLFGTWGQPRQTDGILLHLNHLLFGGLLSVGAITAPAFASIFLSNIITNDRKVPLLTFGIVLLFAWWMTDWKFANFTIFGILKSTFVFLGIVYMAYVTYQNEDNSKNLTGLSLLSLWITYTTLFVFAQHAFDHLSPFALFILILLINYSWHAFINTEELTFASSHLLGSEISMRNEIIRTCRKVEGDCGAKPHIYAVVFTWLVYLVIEQIQIHVDLKDHIKAITFGAMLASYLCILTMIVKAIIDKRFSLKLWRDELHSRRQILIDDARQGTPIELDLATSLKAKKASVLRRELFYQAGIVISTTLLFYDVYLPGTEFPLGLALSFAAFFLSDHLVPLVKQIYKLLISRASISHEVLDLSQIQEPEENESLLGRLKGLLEPSSKLASFLKILFFILVIAHYLYKFYQRFF